MNQQSFFYRNRVLIIGLLSAIVTAILQVTGDAAMTTLNYMALGYAVVMAILSWIANNLRGKWISLSGIVGTLTTAVTTVYANPHQNWGIFLTQLLGSLVSAVLAIVAPPPKPASYEKDPVIQQAKT